MKTLLRELTMSQYIDLVCGDLSVLSPFRFSQKEGQKVRREIMFEYQSICDSASAKSYLTTARKKEQSKIRQTIFTICNNLYELGRIEEVRSIFREIGIREKRMDDERVKAEIMSGIAKAQREAEQEEISQDSDETSVRASYDTLTASLMSHFKFQIDTETIKASVYANLVAQCHREVKAQTEMLRKRK